MSYLIEDPKTGETCHVKSLDGYADWKVLAEGTAAKPKEGCRWDGKAWKTCPVRSAERERNRIAHEMSREDLVEMVLNLKARLDAAGIPETSQ